MENLLSPKQVAQAMGVSESSLKRWCDKGLIPTIRTAGGHRKLPVGAVMSFLRQNCRQLVNPEVLGLPPITGKAVDSPYQAVALLVESLQQGNSEVARRVIFDLYLAGYTVVRLCDEIIAQVFHQLGSGWQCGDIEVYQERRACEIIMRLLHELSLALPAVDLEAPTACGGALQGDYYTLPTMMVELTLRDQGWNARSFGNNLPVATWIAALHDHKPRLFWVSVSYIPEVEQFVRDFNELWLTAAQLSIPLIVGGRELPFEVRRRIQFTAHYDNLTQMLNFSRSLLQQTGYTPPQAEQSNSIGAMRNF